MTEEWFIYQNDKKHGPITPSKLKEIANKGKVAPDDLLWRDGLDDWIPARKVKGLFPAAPPPPPKPEVNKPRPAAIVARQKTTAEKFCSACGGIIDQRAEICPRCGVRQLDTSAERMNNSPNKVVACLFALFLGLFGAHHFYLGHTGLGLLYLLLNVFLFWTIIVPVVFAFICIIEGLVYLTYSDAAFAERYRRR